MIKKALIIDDDAYVREHIQEIITTHFAKEVVIMGQAAGVATGVELISKFDPDLLFLDINMKDGTGFDLLEKASGYPFDIIFVTGFDQHAIKAIKMGALDYILKPIEEEELILAVEKSIAQNRSGQHLQQLLEVSRDYFRSSEDKRIILRTSDAVYPIEIDQIIYCEADSNYTSFFIEDRGKIVISKTLKSIEEVLPQHQFVRCHQSFIVNKKKVLKFDKQGVLIMTNGAKIPVSNRRKEHTLKLILD